MTTEATSTLAELIDRATALAAEDLESGIKLLQDAAADLPSESTDLPLLHLAVADIYQDGGECDKAAASYRIAANRLRAQRGEENEPALFHALHGLTYELRHLGEYDEALSVADEFVGRARCSTSEQDRHLLEALSQRGGVLHGLRRPIEAIVDIDQAQAIGRRIFKGLESDPDVVLTLARSDVTLGNAYCSISRCDEAAESLESACDGFRLARMIRDDAAMKLEHAKALRRLADELEGLQRCDEASAALDLAASLCARLEGPASEMELARVMSRRSMSLRHLSRAGEAVGAAAQAVEMIEHFSRSDADWLNSPEFATALANLGHAHAAVGNCEEAVEVFRRADEIFRHLNLEAGRELEWFDLRATLALELTHEGELPEAIEIFEDVLPGIQPFFDSGKVDKSSYATWLETLSLAYRQTGEEAKAAAVETRARELAGEEGGKRSGHDALPHEGYVN